MAATDELPPHDQLLAERRAAKQQRPRDVVTDIAHRELWTTGRLAGKVADLEPIARHLEASVVEQHAVLERLVDVEPDLGLRVQIELRAQRLDGDWFT